MDLSFKQERRQGSTFHFRERPNQPNSCVNHLRFNRSNQSRRCFSLSPQMNSKSGGARLGSSVPSPVNHHTRLVPPPEEEKRTDLIRELLRRHEPVIARAVETAPGYSSISEDLKPC